MTSAPAAAPAAIAPTCYYVPSEATSPKFAKAFAHGCGGQVSNNLSTLVDGPYAAFGTPPTWPLLKQAQAAGRDFYYGDHGYWARGNVFRISKNTVQYQPTDEDLRSAKPWRFKSLGAQINPHWQTAGRHILICPNSDVYMREFTGYGQQEWVAVVQATLRTYTDRPFIARSKLTKRPIAEDLVDAHAVVAFTSASAVDGLIAGVPCFTLAPWAATYHMGLGDLARIETPVYPDNREQFCWALAEHQWTLSEIATGAAWRKLNAKR